MPPIFVMGLGRSGTTLVQRLLNTHKDIVIWGEHGGTLTPIADAYHMFMTNEQIDQQLYSVWNEGAEKTIRHIKKTSENTEWANSFDKNIVGESFRTLIINLFTNGIDSANQYWGFKEVRYRASGKVLEMLAALFPSAKFIFIFRHPVNVITSRLLAWSGEICEKAVAGDLEAISTITKNIERTLVKYVETNAYFQNFARQHPDSRLQIKYETLCQAQTETIQKMFGFIGVETPSVTKAVMKKNKTTMRERPAYEAIRRMVSTELDKHKGKTVEWAWLDSKNC